MNAQSRRKHERYLCEMIVWLRIYDSMEEFSLVDVENISSGGLLVHSTHDWPLNSLLELQISFLHQKEMISIRAKVAHCRFLGVEDYKLGLEFVETPDLNPKTFVAVLEAMFC